MFTKRSYLIAFCLCVLLQGCGPKNEVLSDLVLAHEVSPQPARVGHVTITLKPTDGSAKPVTGARIFVEGHMTHPGMNAVGIKMTESEPGTYQGIVELAMAGDWIMVAHVIVPGRGQTDRQFEIKGVLPE